MNQEDQFVKVLDKLILSFDDFKERLIRIEENVKDVKNVKSDVEELKIKMAALESKATSAHKRIDAHDDSKKWLWRTIGASAIGLVFIIFRNYTGL